MALLVFIIIIVFLFVYIAKNKQKWESTNLKNKTDEIKSAEDFTHVQQFDTPIENPQVKRLRYFCIKDKGYHVSVWPKNEGIQGVDYLEFPIAGITHGEHIDEHLGEFAATQEPDPTNPYDQNAIKIVTSEGHRVGYVPKDQTAYVRDFTTLPCRCYCYIGTNDGMYYTDCYITKKMTNERKCFTLRVCKTRETPINKG